jgi:hypothetical protein
MRLVGALTLVLTLVLVLGGCKGDPVKCDQGCRNFATLVYWKTADAEIAAAPAEERDALRKRLLGKFEQKLASGVDLCVSQCKSAGNTEQIDCMIAAKTADQALACTK